MWCEHCWPLRVAFTHSAAARERPESSSALTLRASDTIVQTAGGDIRKKAQDEKSGSRDLIRRDLKSQNQQCPLRPHIQPQRTLRVGTQNRALTGWLGSGSTMRRSDLRPNSCRLSQSSCCLRWSFSDLRATFCACNVVAPSDNFDVEVPWPMGTYFNKTSDQRRSLSGNS